jgi:hypothetical protein
MMRIAATGFDLLMVRESDSIVGYRRHHAMRKPIDIPETRHDRPASQGPGGADAPASQNVGRIMNSKVYSARTDKHSQKCGERHEIEA